MIRNKIKLFQEETKGTLVIRGSIMASTHSLVLIILFSAIYFNDGVKANCGYMIDDKIGGMISSPNFPHPYPPNLECIWEIRTTPDRRIGVLITHLVLESQSNCEYDSVTLKSKMEDGTFREHGKFCGRMTTPEIVSDTNILVIRFRSDGGSEYAGFRLNYLSVSNLCGDLIKTSEGIITSPLYPFKYPPNKNCTWTIQAPEAHNIKLNFSRFETEESSECDKDYVTVKSKMADGEIRDHGKFCGKDHPPTIFSDSNILFLQFVSDYESEYSGFKADFSFVGCGGLIGGSKGNISTPFYPNSYPPDKMCEWAILVPPQHKLKLRFLDFETEEGGDDCTNDFLLIQSRTTDGDIKEIGKYCSRNWPPVIYSKDTILLTFVSDLRFQARGFRAEYFIDKFSKYELSTSLVKPTSVYPNNLSTLSQYENEETENVTSINEVNILSEALKVLSEKVASIEDSQKILFSNYENMLKISNLLTSKNSLLNEEGKNSSSSIGRQLSNDCTKYIYFLRRILDSEP